MHGLVDPQPRGPGLDHDPYRLHGPEPSTRAAARPRRLLSARRRPLTLDLPATAARSFRPWLARLAVLGAAWVLVLAAGPWLARDRDPVAALLASLGGLVLGRACHQLPARCLELGGVPALLCARCTGLALGMGLAGACAAALPVLARSRARRWLLAAAFPLLADVALQALGVYFSNATRLATGVVCGFGATAAVLGTLGAGEAP